MPPRSGEGTRVGGPAGRQRGRGAERILGEEGSQGPHGKGQPTRPGLEDAGGAPRRGPRRGRGRWPRAAAEPRPERRGGGEAAGGVG